MGIVDFSNIDQEIEENGDGDFSAMPEHENAFMVTSAQLKQGNENSWYFEVVSEVIGDKYKGRKIWSNMYVISKKGEENKVAKIQYGKLCKACGITDPLQMQEPNNLLQKMYSGKVVVKKGSLKNAATGECYPDSNEINNPKPIAGVVTEAASPVQETVVTTSASQPASSADGNIFGQNG